MFGIVPALIYTVKYQKRRLSHAHIIIFLTGGYAFSEPKTIDNLIRAELPDRALDSDRSLTEIVKQIIVHGLYGSLKFNTICIKKAHANIPLTCFKRFPKPFANKTIVNSDGYPEYRRRQTMDDVNVQWGDEGMYDNRWIVPYNPYLIRRYKAYINVEIYITVQAVKYIHKYIYKRRDRATLEIADTDEIRRYMIYRYISPF